MIADPWWAGFVAGIITAYSPTVLIFAAILVENWKRRNRNNGNGEGQQ